MIPYVGLPVTPATVAIEAVAGGHAFVSFRHQQQLGLALEVCQSNAFDNGAFSAWAEGKSVTDWRPFYEWVGALKRHPTFDFAVIPDVIDGNEESNDMLLAEWPHEKHLGAPVWHMHESYERLLRLAHNWPRICIGSSGQFRTVGTEAWWLRIGKALDLLCGDSGFPPCKIHGLRMLNPKVFRRLPLSSADSTNIGRNVNIDKRWEKIPYPPPTREARARLMRQRLECEFGAQMWDSSL